MKRQRSHGVDGFTLLEALVATVLLASVFVAVLSLSTQSLRNVARMQPQEIALLHAREKMNQLLLLEELQPGSSSGSWDDGYRWEARIDPNVRDAATRGAEFGLFDIRVVISWGGSSAEKTYAVETTQWARKVTSNASP